MTTSAAATNLPRKKFNYIGAVHSLCWQLKIPTLHILKLTNVQSEGEETKYTFLLEVWYLGNKLTSRGTGLSKKKAKMETCKNFLIQIVHQMQLSNPVPDLELLDDCGLTQKDVSDYAKSIDKQADNSSAKATGKADDWATFNKRGMGVNKLTCNPTPSPVSSPPKPVQFNYFDIMSRFSRFRSNADSSYSFSELTDQNDFSSLDTKFVFKLHINHRGIEVNGFGSGTTKLKARTEACRKTLIKLVHRLKLLNPTISLHLASYGVTESELAEYEKGLTDKQANDWFAKTVLSPLTRTEKTPINLGVAESEKTPANFKTDLTSEKLSDLQAGLFVKAPSGAQNKPPSDAENKLPSDGQDKPPSSAQKVVSNELKCSEIEGQQAANDEQPVDEIANEKTTGQQEESHLMQIQKQLDKIENTYLKGMANELKKLTNAPQSQSASSDLATVHEAVAYLQEHQSLFQELLVLHEENPMSYTALIHWIINSMPQRKLEYEFNSSDRVGIGQLFYKDLCIQIVFKSCQATSCPDPTSLEEACSRKMFFFLKMNYS